jgi:hypothetical protein
VRAFIVRPFGTKEGIDFGRVEKELISPALDRLEITGRTTEEIAEQGNIRVDMFQRLATADLVIADISIHNANVFYELGLRHALRERMTFLLRSRGVAEVPFDLKTDRYLAYEADDPAATLEALVRGLRATVDSGKADSQGEEGGLERPGQARERCQRGFAGQGEGDLEEKDDSQKENQQEEGDVEESHEEEGEQEEEPVRVRGSRRPAVGATGRMVLWIGRRWLIRRPPPNSAS